MRTDIPWVSRYPRAWEARPLFAVAERVIARNDRLAERNLLSLSFGRVVRKDIDSSDGLLPASFGSYHVVSPGDLVFRLTDLQNDKNSLRTGLVRERGIITSAYTTVTPKGVDPRYAAYLFRAYDLSKVFYGLGGGVRQSLNFDDIARIPVLVPPNSVQVQIADYLDRETAQIDTLIAEQERLLKLLAERRAAVIDRHLGRDLPGAVTDKLGRRARVGNGSTPRREKMEFWSDGGTPWLNSSVVNQGTVSEADQYVTDRALEECHLPLVAPGSLLVGLTGQGRTRGMAALLEMESTISQHIAYVTPDPSVWDSRFLLWLLRSRYRHLRRISEVNGSTKGGLTCQQLKDLRLPRPELADQRELAHVLQCETKAIDTTMRETDRLIALARERRAALITAAVTGQLDIPEAV